MLNYALVFELDLHLHHMNDKVKAGEYAIPSRASLADIAAILVSGKSIQHKLTAAEGLTSDMIYKLVPGRSGAAGRCRGRSRRKVRCCRRPIFSPTAPPAPRYWTACKRRRRNFSPRIWPARARATCRSRPWRQAVILASIVEKETSLPEERRHIAAVFVNRLKAGMKLQSDPTIIYGISKGYPLGRGIRESEILGDTPYNTYVIAGLPPAPDLQSRQGFSGGGAEPGNQRRSLFRRHRPGRPCLRRHHGRARQECDRLSRLGKAEGKRRRGGSRTGARAAAPSPCDVGRADRARTRPFVEGGPPRRWKTARPHFSGRSLCCTEMP